MGLPPTADEIAEFEADSSEFARARVVDRLLAHPGYGMRWGRRWLDVARFAETNGYERDGAKPHAWRYRDWVINALNSDLPYDRFVTEQLAGDEVPDRTAGTLVATTFLRLGTWDDEPADPLVDRYEQLDDIVGTVSTAFLGLTLRCARCHNHKTEPITSRDYYSLLAIFNGTEKHGLVPGTEDAEGKKVAIDPDVTIQALVERTAAVPPTFIMRRGNAGNRGEEVGPAVPAVLVAQPLEFPQPALGARSSGRRRMLAAWIAAPENPLTWRVLANRVWQHHFGRGLVATPSNFGVSGGAPSHPELLDWLASRLIADGGRLKPFHRLILSSATYRQSSHDRVEGRQIDPANELLWRMNVRRLEAEAIRDAVLSTSGRLNFEAGGPGIKPRIRAELLTGSQRNKWPRIDREGEEHFRRSVYIYVKRQLLMPIMELFDAPTTTDSCAARMTSVVPTQALLLMNDDFIEEQSGFLAERAVAERGDELPRVLTRMFELALGRPPDPSRLHEVVSFVRSRESHGDRRSALADLAHVMFNSSEFVYVE